MATIRPRKRADGTVSYTVQIRIKKDGEQVYQESQTFERKKAAEVWAKRRETELNEPGAIERSARSGHILADIIDRYLQEVGKAQPLGKTKEATLNAIRRSYLGQLTDKQVTSQTLVDFALWRMGPEGGGVKPQTAGNDLAHLGAVMSVANAAWGYEIDPVAMMRARLVLKKLGYKMKSRERDRRPTMEELDRLLGAFFRSHSSRPTSMPMAKIAAFALFSTRRQEEIVRIRWADLDEKRRAVLVRDMKNPGDKWGNDVWCNLPDEAWGIIQSMPRVYEEIFPYTVDAIQGAWARAVEAEQVVDLHFHDLRHEGISRLFEMGWDIPRVSSVSGHRNWNSLRRYTHLHAQGDRYGDWEWLPKVLAVKVQYGEWVGRKKAKLT
ncbi:site-specific integrase [Pseudomonas stutzeri]|uniref:tyrosine-type recombinase/integrase n=1 Tax=Stutzerimonas stutzeri TaxID=316 RepID=UPI00210D71D4|nr:site-specific integrase [Stutzerimonas stutzeri]